MSQKNFHFRGQMHNEEVIEFFRRHWIVVLPHVIPFVLVMTGVIVFLVYLPQFILPTLEQPFFQVLVILATIGITFFIHRFFLKMIEYFMRIVIITNYRVVNVHKTLFLNDDKESIVMKRMQDLQKQQKGIISILLKVGDIIILISHSEPKIIRNVPSPDYHFRLLNQIRSQLYERSHKAVGSSGDKVGLKEFKPKVVGNETEAGVYGGSAPQSVNELAKSVEKAEVGDYGEADEMDDIF